MNEIVYLKEVSFIRVVKYTWLFLKLPTIAFLVLFILLYTFGILTEYLVLLWSLSIYFFGIFISFVLHEFSHIVALKKFSQCEKIEIEITRFKFSIKPLVPTLPNSSFLVALLGPLSCGGVALILYGLNKYFFESSNFLLILSFCFGVHMINLFPFSNDGKMLIKSIITLLERM